MSRSIKEHARTDDDSTQSLNKEHDRPGDDKRLTLPGPWIISTFNSKTVHILPSLSPSLWFPFYLLPSPVHPTGFPFCFFCGLLAVFILLSSNTSCHDLWTVRWINGVKGKKVASRIRDTSRYNWEIFLSWVLFLHFAISFIYIDVTSSFLFIPCLLC